MPAYKGPPLAFRVNDDPGNGMDYEVYAYGLDPWEENPDPKRLVMIGRVSFVEVDFETISNMHCRKDFAKMMLALRDRSYSGIPRVFVTRNSYVVEPMQGKGVGARIYEYALARLDPKRKILLVKDACYEGSTSGPANAIYTRLRRKYEGSGGVISNVPKRKKRRT